MLSISRDQNVVRQIIEASRDIALYEPRDSGSVLVDVLERSMASSMFSEAVRVV